jgi:hypothetical protein
VNRVTVLSLGIVLTLGLSATVFSQEQAVSQEDKTKEPMPPNTNPTQRAIYPGEGQTEEQQLTDQLECYRWATAQTGWDPYQAYDVLVEKGYVTKQTVEEAEGGLVKGAARGALVGLAIGAIAGDAGKGAAIGAAAGGLGGGMRSRRKQEAAQSEMDQAIDAFNRQLEKWDSNYTACMTGKKYTVS